MLIGLTDAAFEELQERARREDRQPGAIARRIIEEALEATVGAPPPNGTDDPTRPAVR